jgi:hypothetical protein
LRGCGFSLGDGGALPLPLFAGEGWGGGVSADALIEGIDLPPPAALFRAP